MDTNKSQAHILAETVQNQVETALMGDLERLAWFRILDDDQKRRLNDLLHDEAVDRVKIEDELLLRLIVQVTTYEVLLERQSAELTKRADLMPPHQQSSELWKPGRN